MIEHMPSMQKVLGFITSPVEQQYPSFLDYKTQVSWEPAQETKRSPHGPQVKRYRNARDRGGLQDAGNISESQPGEPAANYHTLCDPAALFLGQATYPSHQRAPRRTPMAALSTTGPTLKQLRGLST